MNPIMDLKKDRVISVESGKTVQDNVNPVRTINAIKVWFGSESTLNKSPTEKAINIYPNKNGLFLNNLICRTIAYMNKVRMPNKTAPKISYKL